MAADKHRRWRRYGRTDICDGRFMLHATHAGDVKHHRLVCVERCFGKPVCHAPFNLTRSIELASVMIEPSCDDAFWIPRTIPRISASGSPELLRSNRNRSVDACQMHLAKWTKRRLSKLIRTLDTLGTPKTGVSICVRLRPSAVKKIFVSL